MTLQIRSAKKVVKHPSVKSRLFVWPVGESLLESLRERHDRPVEEYRKLFREVLGSGAGRLLLGLPDRQFKLSWSQRAGCQCGCSPGFVLDACLGYDLHVDVGYPEEKTKSEIAKEVAKELGIEYVDLPMTRAF